MHQEHHPNLPRNPQIKNDPDEYVAFKLELTKIDDDDAN